MVRILCCMVSVFSVATEAQICANNDQFDESVSKEFWQPGATCGSVLSQVTDLDFVPSATTCRQESITYLKILSDTVNYTVQSSRLQLLREMTSCCKDGKTSCDDYMVPVCKNMNKFDGSAEFYRSPTRSYGTCARDAIHYLSDALATSSQNATACLGEVKEWEVKEYSTNLQMVLASMSECCEDGETACSDFHAPICENKDQFDGFVNSGVAMREHSPEYPKPSTCLFVSSAMDAFVPSKETCSEQITMPGFVCCDGTKLEVDGGCGDEFEDMCGGGNMSRMLVLEQFASCCTGNTACDPYKDVTTTTTATAFKDVTTTTITGASSNAVEQVCFSAVLITAGLML